MTALFTKLFATLAMALAALFAPACSSADTIVMCANEDDGVRQFPGYTARLSSVSLSLPEFSAIYSDNTSDIRFIQKPGVFSIRAVAHLDDPLKYLDIRVDKGNLFISRRKDVKGGEVNSRYGNRHADSYITLYVTAPALSLVCMRGTADFACDSYSSDSEFNVIMKGTGDISFSDFKVPILSVNSMGTGDLVIKNASVPESHITIGGTGDVVVDKYTGSQAMLTLNGTGDFVIPDLRVTNLVAILSGTGDFNIKGNASESAEYSVSGTGDLNASAFKAPRVTATVTGPGSLDCFASSSILATRTFGDLTYRGNPKSVKTSGEVRHK